MTTVVAAILAHEGRILIARRRRGRKQASKWEFPGGKIEPGETPRQCLERELKEEFDIDVAVKEYVGETAHRYPDGAIRLVAYRARWRGGEIRARDHDAFAWVSLDQLGNYDFSAADLPFVDKLRSGEIRL